MLTSGFQEREEVGANLICKGSAHAVGRTRAVSCLGGIDWQENEVRVPSKT
jgi:hypothetical protein